MRLSVASIVSTALVAAMAIGAAPAAAHEGHAGHAPFLKAGDAFGAQGTASFAALAVPAGFTETIAFSGLTTPTNIEVRGRTGACSWPRRAA